MARSKIVLFLSLFLSGFIYVLGNDFLCENLTSQCTKKLQFYSFITITIGYAFYAFLKHREKNDGKAE